MATDALVTGIHPNFNDLTPEIRADMLLSIQRLVRLAQFPDSQLDEKKLAWEVIRSIRAEMREHPGTSADLAKAVAGLMPHVNVQVNVDSIDERRRLQARAENGLTQRSRDQARRQLEQLTTTDKPEPIQAAEKPEDERT